MTEVRPYPLKEAVTRRMLTLVLLAVLVWYTFVVPAPAAFVRHSGGGARDAEERGGQAGATRLPGDRRGAEAASVDDLDWPEYIGGE